MTSPPAGQTDPNPGRWINPPGTHRQETPLTAAVPEGSVVITPAEVYGKVVALTDAVTKLVAADESDARELARLETTVEEHGRRLSAIERKLWLLTGAAATAGGAIGSAIVPLIGQ